MGVFGGDQHRREHAVIVLGILLVGAAVLDPLLALRAVYFLGVVELAAIQRDQGSIAKHAIRVERRRRLDGVQCNIEPHVESGAVDAIELLAKMIVRQYRIDLEQGMAGMTALLLFGHALML